MKRSEIYLRAARQVARCDGFSCIAVDDQAGPFVIDSYARRTYAQLMGLPKFCCENAISDEIDAMPRAERQHLRVLMLCLAAAVAESEGQ